MKVIRYPERETWKSLLERPRIDMSALWQSVGEILADVKARGDAAVFDWEERFDHVRPASLAVSLEEMDAAEALVSTDLKDALRLAEQNIATFHAAQRFVEKRVETSPGVCCWQKAVPIERVGLYVPGGTAPLFSTVWMLAVPARLAGCREIVLCTPPDCKGNVHPAILYAARLAGVGHVYKAGGVQAIGAMAYGTESIPRVNKIFGPGNRYVMAAKQQVSLRDVAIDMPAGPSEVAILAGGQSCVCGCRLAVAGRAWSRQPGVACHHLGAVGRPRTG